MEVDARDGLGYGLMTHACFHHNSNNKTVQIPPKPRPAPGTILCCDHIPLTSVQHLGCHFSLWDRVAVDEDIPTTSGILISTVVIRFMTQVYARS